MFLTGDGGDEIFGGYARYERELSVERTPPLLRSLLGYTAMLMPTGIRGKKRLSNMRRDLPTRYIEFTKSFPDGFRSYLYDREYFAQVRSHDATERLINEFRTVSHLDIAAQMQHVDVRHYLADDILVKVDKASMFNSLETRAPLLDHRLAEYVSSLPTAIRMQPDVLKSLLKKAGAYLLPAEILNRSKQGFSVPIRHWFRSDLNSYAHDMLLSPHAQQRGIFNPQFIRNLLKEHAEGKRLNHSESIWTLLCLELWFQAYMDTSSPSIELSVPMRITSN